MSQLAMQRSAVQCNAVQCSAVRVWVCAVLPDAETGRAIYYGVGMQQVVNRRIQREYWSNTSKVNARAWPCGIALCDACCAARTCV